MRKLCMKKNTYKQKILIVKEYVSTKSKKSSDAKLITNFLFEWDFLWQTLKKIITEFDYF